MSPETIGLVRADEAGIVLGKHSGRNALSTRLGQLGFELEEAALNDVFKRFKNLADRKKVSGGGWVGWLLLRLVQSV
jgi:2-isopropylmalate synthase